MILLFILSLLNYAAAFGVNLWLASEDRWDAVSALWFVSALLLVYVTAWMLARRLQNISKGEKN